MGFVSSLLGTAGGANGTGFASPQGANIQNPVNTQQANNIYGNVNNNLAQQQSFLQALQNQNGIQNQSNVFNQLQGVANGTGPNPAQAMLAQATGANTANQAALMAGQRGSGANAGLIARQAAQQGAANQQQAAGQGATMQANQSLAALNQLGGLAGQQVSQQAAAQSAATGANMGEQQTLLNQINAQNTANVQQQSNINSANAGLATTQMQGQQGLLGGLANAAGPAVGAISKLFASGGPVMMSSGGYTPVSIDTNNNDPVFPTNPDAYGAAAYNPIGNPNTPISAAPTPSTSDIPTTPVAPSSPNAPGKFTSFLNSQSKGNSNAPTTASQFNYGNPGANQLAAGVSNGLSNLFAPSTPQQQGVAPYSNSNPIIAGGPQDTINNTQSTMPMNDQGQMTAAKGGKVPALVSPGEVYLKPKDVQEVKKGKDPIKAGEKIPGKPKVKGAKNSYANDTVPKTLEEGGIVLPRSVTMAKHPHWEAMKFIQATMTKNGKSLPKKVK